MGSSFDRSRLRTPFAQVLFSALALSGCGDRKGSPHEELGGTDESGETDAETDGGEAPADTPDDGLGGEIGGVEGEGVEECEAPPHTPCDKDSNDLPHAIGLNCPGEAQFEITFDGPDPGARGVGQKLGETSTWDPIEGGRFLVLGNGLVSDLTYDGVGCNSAFEETFEPVKPLPEPLKAIDVGAENCFENPELVGTGDCSNSIQGQFDQGMRAFDYTEMRIKAKVPTGVSSLSYNFAFFSTEYPLFYGQSYNDMYVAWLESEHWTGNISFDEMGNPISLNAGFLDFKDDDGDMPEFAGTCLKGCAGTKWLSSTASVTSEEDIVLVFAIFDLADAVLDSFVFIDNFAWGCEGDLPPNTIPIG